MQRKPGDLLIIALELIGNASITVAELLDTLTSDYGTLRKIAWGKEEAAPGTKKLIRELVQAVAGDIRDRRQIHDLLYRLRRDGLVAEQGTRGGSLLTLTDSGERKRMRLLDHTRHAPRYAAERADDFVIVAFDVPERERRKRAWLRVALTDLGMVCVQQSVWVGKVKIPKSFLVDLVAQELDSYVEIFSVSGAGTLRKLEESGTVK